VNIEAGKYYKTRDGRKVFVCAIAMPNPFAESVEVTYPVIGYIDPIQRLTWAINGELYRDSKSAADLVAEWREPRTWNYWLGVYDFHGDVMAVAYSTRPAIDRFFSMDSDRKVLSIKEVTVTEGVFA
jgi:hypothetical protein